MCKVLPRGIKAGYRLHLEGCGQTALKVPEQVL